MKNNKQKNESVLNIWFISVFCFFAIGTPIFLKCQEYLYDKKWRFFYHPYDLPIDVGTLSMILAIVTFIIVFTLSVTLSPLLCNLACKSITKHYPNEKIVYFYCPIVNLMHFAIALFGSCIVRYIIPLFIDPTLDYINIVTRDNIIFYNIFAFYMLFFCIEMQYTAIFLTNKKLVQRSPFTMSNSTKEISFSDIKRIDEEWPYIFVHSNNGGCIVLLKRISPDKTKECYKKLMELLNGAGRSNPPDTKSKQVKPA